MWEPDLVEDVEAVNGGTVESRGDSCVVLAACKVCEASNIQGIPFLVDGKARAVNEVSDRSTRAIARRSHGHCVVGVEQFDIVEIVSIIVELKAICRISELRHCTMELMIRPGISRGTIGVMTIGTTG